MALHAQRNMKNDSHAARPAITEIMIGSPLDAARLREAPADL
jgi:hypothetical protein